jgi:hypothetical protein
VHIALGEALDKQLCFWGAASVAVLRGGGPGGLEVALAAVTVAMRETHRWVGLGGWVVWGGVLAVCLCVAWLCVGVEGSVSFHCWTLEIHTSKKDQKGLKQGGYP